MQWDETPKAGFTDGTPWIDLPLRRENVSAQAEAGDETSILSYYRRLIRLRKQEPVIADGDIRFVLPEEEGIIAYERLLDGRKMTVYCNFTAEQRAVPFAGGSFVLGSYEDAPQIENSRVFLRPFEGCAFK